MADLTDIITSAVADAGGGEGDNTPDPGGVDNGDSGVDNTPEPVGSEGVTVPEGSAKEPAKEAAPEVDPTTGKPVEKAVEKPVVKAKTPEEEQLDKDLAELGFRAPKEGERENRLPHSRVQKMMGNYGKKLTERHNAVLAAKEAEYAPFKTTAENTANVDRLIATDPDRYITLLAGLHPDKYGKFVKGGQVEGSAQPEVKPNEALAALGPRPVADHKFEDGSMGYTPEQHDKLLDWVASKARIDAEAAVEARLTKRFGPIEKAFNSVQARNAAIPKVRAEVSAVYQTWGKELVDKHEDAIVKTMEKNKGMSPADAAATVLVPILRADRNKMRTELIDEANKRPAAAVRQPAAAATVETDKGETTGDPIEDAIRSSVAALRR